MSIRRKRNAGAGHYYCTVSWGTGAAELDDVRVRYRQTWQTEDAYLLLFERGEGTVQAQKRPRDAERSEDAAIREVHCGSYWGLLSDGSLTSYSSDMDGSRKRRQGAAFS